MKKHAAALVAIGAVGFLAGGARGAAAGGVAWAAVLVGRWWFRANTQVLPEPEEQTKDSGEPDFDEVVENLDDLAQERDWDLDKHFAIARMACANRTMTVDELEHRYDQGLASAPDRIRRDVSEGSNNDESA